MATNLPSCFSIEFIEHLLKFLVNFTLLKYVKSHRSYGFLITKELIFGFQILDLKDHFSASLKIVFAASFSGEPGEIFLLVLCFLFAYKNNLQLVLNFPITENIFIPFSILYVNFKTDT